MEDVIIIGSGPAGLSAGIYAARAGLKPVVFEGLESGGQLMQTQHVSNYPGFPETVSGPTIIAAMRKQAETAGVRFVMDVVESVDFTDPVKRLSTMMGDTFETKTVIVATGAGVTKTNLPGETKYLGRGISACLTCDGAFYRDRKVVVVGEGPAARGARTYLVRCGAEVVAILAPSEIKEFTGDGARLTGVTHRQPESDDPNGSSDRTIPTDGVFLVTARKPQTDFLGAAVERDEKGHVVVNGTKTSVPGVYAAGDCARPHHKQAVIAAGDGALAALEAQAYLTALHSRVKGQSLLIE